MSQSKWNVVFSLTVLVALSLSALPCAAVVVDAVVNGDMELGGTPTTPPTNWDFGNDGVVGISNDTPDGSAQSMSVLNDGTGFYQGLARQDATLDPRAHSVQLSFSYKGDGPRWAMQAGPGSDDMGADHPTKSVDWTGYSTDWKVVPDGTPFIRVLLYDIDHRNADPVLFDNVRLISYIPEPGSALLLGACVLGVVGARRRRRAQG